MRRGWTSEEGTKEEEIVGKVSERGKLDEGLESSDTFGDILGGGAGRRGDEGMTKRTKESGNRSKVIRGEVVETGKSFEERKNEFIEKRREIQNVREGRKIFHGKGEIEHLGERKGNGKEEEKRETDFACRGAIRGVVHHVRGKDEESVNNGGGEGEVGHVRGGETGDHVRGGSKGDYVRVPSAIPGQFDSASATASEAVSASAAAKASASAAASTAAASTNKHCVPVSPFRRRRWGKLEESFKALVEGSADVQTTRGHPFLTPNGGVDRKQVFDAVKVDGNDRVEMRKNAANDGRFEIRSSMAEDVVDYRSTADRSAVDNQCRIRALQTTARVSDSRGWKKWKEKLEIFLFRYCNYIYTKCVSAIVKLTQNKRIYSRS